MDSAQAPVLVNGLMKIVKDDEDNFVLQAAETDVSIDEDTHKLKLTLVHIGEVQPAIERLANAILHGEQMVIEVEFELSDVINDTIDFNIVGNQDDEYETPILEASAKPIVDAYRQQLMDEIERIDRLQYI